MTTTSSHSAEHVQRPRGAWAVSLVVVVAAIVAIVPALVGAQVLAHPRSWSWGEVLGFCTPVLGGVLGAGMGRLLKGAEWRRSVRRQANEAVVVGIALVVLGVGGAAITALAAASTHHDAAALEALAAAQLVAGVALIGVCFRLARNGRRMVGES
jgi:hypothetical protein